MFESNLVYHFFLCLLVEDKVKFCLFFLSVCLCCSFHTENILISDCSVRNEDIFMFVKQCALFLYLNTEKHLRMEEIASVSSRNRVQLIISLCVCLIKYNITIWRTAIFIIIKLNVLSAFNKTFPFFLSVLGFDHCHPEVYEHCKRLLLHLLIVMGSGSNVQSVASVLLRNREFNESRMLTVKQTTHLDYTFTGMLLHLLKWHGKFTSRCYHNLFYYTIFQSPQ